jgi:hypothetical protein
VVCLIVIVKPRYWGGGGLLRECFVMEGNLSSCISNKRLAFCIQLHAFRIITI